MYLNHIQEKFQISTFGGILVEFGSMDKKSGFYDKQFKNKMHSVSKNNELYNKYDINANKND